MRPTRIALTVAVAALVALGTAPNADAQRMYNTAKQK